MLYVNRKTRQDRVLATQHDGSKESIRRIKGILVDTNYSLEVSSTLKHVEILDKIKKGLFPNAQQYSTLSGKRSRYYLKFGNSFRKEIIDGMWVVVNKSTKVVQLMTEESFRVKYGEHPLEIRNIEGYIPRGSL